ncbi:MAG: patatin-like phospholipase family protein [Burkholderiales bacterium]|nr:patatin-like phospholipase family protein [Betaproteobacteria bacterium]
MAEKSSNRKAAQARKRVSAKRLPSPPVGAPRAKIGLALAGGGPLGAMYEIGVLMALDEALDGLNLNEMDVYVGVSAGSFISAGLANRLSPAEIFHLFIENKAADKRTGALKPEVFLRPAFREYFRRIKMLPPLFAEALFGYVGKKVRHPFTSAALESFAPLARALPTGVFENEAIRKFLHGTFSQAGRTDDFRELDRKLYSIATDLDTGVSVRFGGPGYDHVPISQAVQASAALPGLFPPVEIDGHHYVDGALKKTLNASVALEEGAALVLCVNPLVPYDANNVRRRGGRQLRKLATGGLPTVLSQTFRAVIHSRMHVGLQKYLTQYKDRDVVLFEPASDDAEMFFTNLFSYATRKRLCEHAYQRTRQDLLKRRHELEPIFAKYGITLNLAVLRDKSRTLESGLPRRPRQLPKYERLHDASLDLSDAILELERFVARTRRRASFPASPQ